jgi:hypothetical protein
MECLVVTNGVLKTSFNKTQQEYFVLYKIS